jgi:hypothetical protein
MPGFILGITQSLLFVGPDFDLKTFKWFYGPQISANHHTITTGIEYKPGFLLGITQSKSKVRLDFGLKTFKWFYGPQTSANNHIKIMVKMNPNNYKDFIKAVDLSAALSQSLLFVGPDLGLKK